MNCLTARETLDLARLYAGSPDEVGLRDKDENDLPGATIDEAAQHVKGCPACQTVVRRREKIDERIGQLSRDVPVPSGLRERLLARLEVASGPIPTAPQAADKPAMRPRRRMMVAAVAACAVAIASFAGWQHLRTRPASLTLDEIAEFALSTGINPAALPELTQFQGGLVVQLPKTTRELSRSKPVQQLSDPQVGEREIGIYFFTLPGRKGVKIAGRLVVVPASSVKDLPLASSFPGEILYKYGFCTTAWVEGKFVYLCCVRGGEGELLRLRRATQEAA